MVVLKNVVADEQKLVTLMSASGRISYSSDSFLRFWAPEFVNKHLLDSKDRLQGRMKTFSRDMMQILGSNRVIFKEVTEETLRRNGIIYERDLVEQVFGDTADGVTEMFAVHKFLFEGQEWIKDGQWAVNSLSSGPYIRRPQWQQELLFESEVVMLKASGKGLKRVLERRWHLKRLRSLMN